MKKFSSVLGLGFLASAAQASLPTLSEIARDTDGRNQIMNHFEASDYCKARGERLPALRELAEIAHTLGAPMPRDTAYPGVSNLDSTVVLERYEMQKLGFLPVYLRNEKGQLTVSFYLSTLGYKRPDGIEGNLRIWSDTVFVGDAKRGYVFDTYGGAFSDARRDGKTGANDFSATLCIPED